MKKICCLFIILLLCLAGCGKEKAKTQAPTVDLQYYADLGEMPEAALAIGQDSTDLQAELDAAEETGEDIGYVLDDADTGITQLQYGNYAYYCKDDSTVAAIVGFDTAFTFENGALITAVREGCAPAEPKAGTVAADCDLLPGMAGYDTLQYAFEKAVVCFVFYENGLCATVLYNPSVFTL